MDNVSISQFQPVPGWRRFELPTWALIGVIYGGWLALTWHWRALPWWLVLPAGAWLVAWQMSLQHELLHGHPTRHRGFNDALGLPSLSLWLPYRVYRDQHLAHHDDRVLTDPQQDPESYYLSPAAWARLGPWRRAVESACHSLAGRLLLGPALLISRFWATQARQLLRGDRYGWRLWLEHAAVVAVLVWWLTAVCDMPLWFYALLFIYPGYSLALIRSFAEHRAAPLAAHRTAIVENAPVLGLLFLYNNLHVVHHGRAGLPWYDIPAVYRAGRAALIAANGGLVYDGYRDVARRYLLTPHHHPVYPAGPAGAQPAAGTLSPVASAG